MDLTAGADNQLLVCHYNSINGSMQVEAPGSDSSFGPMMALMTAEQIDLDKKSHQQQQSGPSHFMHEYYNDPYAAAVYSKAHLSAHEQLSYEQFGFASCVEAQAVDMSCAQVRQQQLKHDGYGDEDEGGQEEKGEGRILATTMISRTGEKSKPVLLHGSTAVRCSQFSSLKDIVERREVRPATDHVDIVKDEIAVSEMSSSSANHVQEEERIREKIVSHPDYRRLVTAYINCRKVGAPPDVVTRLDELSKEYDMNPELLSIVSKAAAAPDPELDHFMKTYCHVLHQYEEELSKPFNEAMVFFQKVELQISQLVSNGASSTLVPGDDGMSIEVEERELQQVGEELGEAGGEEGEVEVEEGDEEGGSCGEVLDVYESMEAAATCYNNPYSGGLDQQVEEKQLKDQLLKRYRGFIGTLKNEFMKKKKKGKLPKDARQRLLDWWHEHYKWPYPSETEKVTLAETTGLDQKQINNWFINQRKRHWKPSDQDMRYVMVNGQDPPMQHEVDTTAPLDQLT